MKNLITLLVALFSLPQLYAQNLVPYQDTKTEKCGYKNEKGIVVIPPKYNRVSYFTEDLATVMLNGKAGFIDKKGKEVIPLRYGAAENFSQGLAAVKMNGRWGYIDKTGKEVIPFKYSKVGNFKCNRALVLNAGKKFFINKQGETVIRVSSYYDASDFSEGLAAIQESKNSDFVRGYIDTTGKMVIPQNYRVAKEFKNGQAIVSIPTGSYWTNMKFGMIDNTGKVIVPFKYNQHSNDELMFYNGYAKVSIDKKFGIIDTTGKEIVPVKYDFLYPDWTNLVFAAKLGAKTQLFDRTGKEIQLPANCSEADHLYTKGPLLIKVNGKYGFIDRLTGKEIAPPQYDDAYDFKEDFAYVSMNSKYGFINIKGQLVIPLKYDGVSYLSGFTEGLVAVQVKDKWGFINKAGKEVVPLKYESADDFSNGFAKVKLDEKEGLIDKTGKVVVPPVYDNISGGWSGYSVVERDGKKGMIDKTGRIIVPVKYDEVADSWHSGLLKVKLDSRSGFVDKTGKEKIPLKYFGALELRDQLVIAPAINKFGIIDINGKERVPFKYDDIKFIGWKLAKVKLEKQYGLLDPLNGASVLPVQYEEIQRINENLFMVKAKGKYGLVNGEGKEMIPAEFDKIDTEGFKNGEAGVWRNYTREAVNFYVDENGQKIIAQP